MGFASPELAAVSGFPRGVARVVASRTNGENAYVLLDTGPATHPYLYATRCHLIGGAWTEGNSSNGPGWSSLSDDLGVLTLWDSAPHGADCVRATFDGESFETDVENGAYLFAWWNVPDDVARPTIDAFRVNGEWIEP